VQPPCLQHCARGIEPASVKLVELEHATVFSLSTAIECGRVQVCSVTRRVLHHSARGIEPASGGNYSMLCFLPEHCARGGTRRVCPCECGSVHVCSPPVRSTVREGLNLPVWSWRDYRMLCFLPEHCARGCARRVCPCERGSVHVCCITRCVHHCVRGIEPASVEGAGPQNALVSCPSNARGVLGPCKRGIAQRGARHGTCR